jgi:hypothetical protein
MATQFYQSYPVFDKNQVLTHNQLNGVVNYLEEQGRMTRSCLIGIGIVCGFKLKTEPAATAEAGKLTLHISKGVGITSHGFLLTQSDCALTKIRSYNADLYGAYRPFQDEDSEDGVQDVELWELLTDDFEDEGSELEISDLQTLGLDDKVVLLYLEQFDKNQKSCLSKGCDEIGIDRKLNLRKLLISQDDLQKVLERTGNEDISLFSQRFDLENFTLNRPGFGEPFNRFETVKELGSPYREALEDDEREPISAIIKNWSDAFHAFRPLLEDEYETDPFSGKEEEVLELLNLFAEHDDLGIHYFYDFIRDLTLAWREFREVSFYLLTECLPERGLFPRHLILGDPDGECKPSKFRQQFIRTPIHDRQNYRLEETRMLFRRAVKLIQRFSADVILRAEDLETRITPSVEKQSALSVRSIPFYYTDIDAADDHGSLLENWNYDQQKRCLGGREVLSYHRHGDGGTPPEVAAPLEYDRSRFNFYRIEGVLGKDCAEVLDHLTQLTRTYNLPFDLQGVRMNDEVPVLPSTAGSSGIDFSNGFHDLHEDYFTFRYQLKNWLKTGISVLGLIVDLQRSRFADDSFSAAFRTVLDESEVRSRVEDNEELQEIIQSLIRFMCEQLPPCVEDFIEGFDEFKRKYAGAVEFVVRKLLKDMADRFDHVNMGTEFENNLERAQRIIIILNRFGHQLLDLIFFNRLYRIYYSWKRREYYHSLAFNRHSMTLESFIEEHPGLEHGAGVSPGGTFVLVYGSNGESAQTVVSDFMLPYRCCFNPQVRIPVCDDDEARSSIMVAPYARPVFAITMMERPVTLDLLNNDHEIYDMEGQHCVDDSQVFRSMVLESVEPVTEDAREAEIGGEYRREVTIEPPRGFIGLLKYRYTIRKESNGLTDTGSLTILVLQSCRRLADFEAVLRPGETTSFMLDVVRDENGNVIDDFRDFRFTGGNFDPEVISMLTGDNTTRVTLQRSIQEPYSFEYTAVNSDRQIGCGTITIRPAQGFSVSGTVRDARSQEVIPGAQVVVAGSNLGAITDVQGNFILRNLPSLQGTLIVSIVGYETAQVPINGNSHLDIGLVPFQAESEDVPGSGILSAVTMRNILNEMDVSQPEGDEQLITVFYDAVAKNGLSTNFASLISDETRRRFAREFDLDEGDTVAIIEIINEFAGSFRGGSSTVSGRVTNAESGSALAGVMVTDIRSGISVGTNRSGHYQLEVSNTNTSVQFSLTGFVTRTESLAGRNELDVAMTPSVRIQPVNPDSGLGLITVRDINNHLDDFTNADLQRLLRNRDIEFSTSENKDELVERLSVAVDENPITREELTASSDTSINRLRVDLLDESIARNTDNTTFLNRIRF